MMALSDYYPIIVAVFVVVGGIAALRMFFTFWGPIERRINGDPLVINKKIHIKSLQDKVVNVHLKSQTTLDAVVLLGFCSMRDDAPYSFQNLLMARFTDGRTVYIRTEEIEYLEPPASDVHEALNVNVKPSLAERPLD